MSLRMNKPWPLLVCLLALAACTLASPAPTPTPTGPAGWPQNVDGAAAVLLTWLDAEQTRTLRQTAREDLIQYHFELGMVVRNEFGLWAGNAALLQSCCQALGRLDCDTALVHPDDCSMVIIERAWELLQEEP